MKNVLGVFTDQGKMTSIAIGATTLAVITSVWRFKRNPTVWTAIPIAADTLILAEQVHRKVTAEV